MSLPVVTRLRPSRNHPTPGERRGAAGHHSANIPIGSAATGLVLQLPRGQVRCAAVRHAPALALFFSPVNANSSPPRSIPEFDSCKLIYRHYATLYFVFAVDTQESDLGILDLIQVFVEALDKCFENVCELDLIFHSDEVMYVLDEIIMAGMVLETNIVNILQSVQDQNKLHAKSIKVISLPSSTSKTTTAIGR